MSKKKKQNKKSKKINKVPRQYSFCKFNDPKIAQEHNYPLDLTSQATLIFFGEIPNQPGHCIVMGLHSKEFHNCYHTYNFTELTMEET
jgi:hypothetical protein